VREGRLPAVAGTADGAPSVTFHDPCYTGRHHGIVDAPRAVVAAAGANLREMPRHGTGSFCCGAGGAQFWKEEEPGDARVADVRYAEAADTGAEVVVTGCPFCRSMLGSATGAQAGHAAPVRDLAVLLADGIDRAQARIDGAAPGSAGAAAGD
jgi:Fe-S oxidoreductase